MGEDPPAAAKPPIQPPPPAQSFRFIMGADAKAGQTVDLDLGTGRLVPAKMATEAALGPMPKDPPPGLFLRLLVTAWRQQAQDARDGVKGSGKLNFAAREALDGAAADLARVLDTIGVPTDLEG